MFYQHRTKMLIEGSPIKDLISKEACRNYFAKELINKAVPENELRVPAEQV
jgi:hypothetical protein